MLLLAASLRPADVYFWWGGAALLVLALMGRSGRRFPVNPLSMSVALFCACLLANAVFVTPHYAAHGLYRPVTLFVAFAVAAVLDRTVLDRFLRAGTGLLAVLVLFGLAQVFLGLWPYQAAERAAAAFVTPNTFATAINLFLLPLIALAAGGRGGRLCFFAMLWLFAGLLSTESRGGWIALLAGLAFIAAYAGGLGAPAIRQRWLRIAAGLLGVMVLYFAAKSLAPTADARGGSSFAGVAVGEFVARGTSFRLELAEIALQQIAERPVAGAGANTFWPLYEMVKPASMNLGFSFPFVHNDYLQTWLEFGLAGVLLLVAVVGAALAAVLRARSRQREDAVMLAGGAALAGFFVHAMVDFPLYVPFPVMLLGFWLGVLAAHGGDARWAALSSLRSGKYRLLLRSPLVAGAAAVAAIAWLAQPAIGELAARRALGQLAAGNAEGGLYWQTVARRFEPRSGRRHWEEGIIRRDQAQASGDRVLAAGADAMFAEGALVDAYDVNNLLDRARLHRQHAQWLDHPAPPEVVLEWNARALQLRPYMLATQAEYARALAFAGRADEARQLAQAMIAKHPESQIARRLAEEL